MKCRFLKVYLKVLPTQLRPFKIQSCAILRPFHKLQKALSYLRNVLKSQWVRCHRFSCIYLQDLTVKCGDTAQFLCVLEDESFVDVTWTHEGVKIEESERVKQSQDGNIQFLTICNVQLVDQGLYSCIAHNDFAKKTTSAVLSVEGGYLIFSYDLLHFILIALCCFSAMQIESVNILIRISLN